MEDAIVDTQLVRINGRLGDVNVNGVTGQALGNDGPLAVLTDKGEAGLGLTNVVHVIAARWLTSAALKKS